MIQAVIAHELGHLKCDHGVWLTMANVLASNTLSVLPLLSGAVEDALLRWLRAAELTCDRAALLVAQDHRLVISALMKLAGGSPKLNKELNVEAFLNQVPVESVLYNVALVVDLSVATERCVCQLCAQELAHGRSSAVNAQSACYR